MTRRPPDPAVPRRPARHWLPLVVTCAATFLLLVYATIVTVALPAITADLGGGFGVTQWLVGGYTLALAGLLMGMGALGDAVGHRGLFVVGMWAFTAATLACGLAPGPALLVLARILQGLAGAALFGTLIPLIGQTYEGRDRATAFAVWGSIAGVGGATGTVIGGVLAQFLSWRWIFLGAVPICLAAALPAAKVLPRIRRRAVSIDVPGIAVLTVAASAITFGVITAGEQGWTGPATIAGLAVGVVAIGGLVLVERRAPAPLLPPGLVRTPAFGGLLLAAGGYFFAAFGLLPALSLWLQDHGGLGALATAMVISVQQVGFLATSTLAGRRLPSLRMRHTIGVGTLVIGLADLGLTLAAATDAGWPALLPGLVLSGIGAGMVSPVLPAAALAAAPTEFGGAASGAASCARQLGLALGVAVLGSVYHQHADALVAVFVVAAVAGLVAGGGAVALLGPGRVASAATSAS